MSRIAAEYPDDASRWVGPTVLPRVDDLPGCPRYVSRYVGSSWVTWDARLDVAVASCASLADSVAGCAALNGGA